MDISGITGGSGISQPSKAQGKDRTELGQEDFLKLMTAQLKNQDPMKPMQSGEFMTQIAQFTSANGIGQMQKSFAEFTQDMKADQALRAAGLVGRQVVVASDSGYLPEGGELGASIHLPRDVDNLTVKVYSAAGEVLDTVELGAQPAGDVEFAWDGQDADGKTLPPGRYSFAASTMWEGETYGLDTFVAAEVESVRLGQNGQSPQLTLAGLGETDLNAVRHIK